MKWTMEEMGKWRGNFNWAGKKEGKIGGEDGKRGK